MEEIKSAFEIAMERTRGVSADKEAVESDKYKKEGKKMISQFLEDEAGSLDDKLKNYDKKQLAWVKTGMFESLSANLVLPADENIMKRIMKTEKGFSKIIKEANKVKQIFGQLANFFKEYHDQKKKLKENLEKQFAPKLKRKADEMSQKLGGKIKLDASSDPEFLGYLKQAMGQLNEQYTPVILQVKEELQRMFSESL